MSYQGKTAVVTGGGSGMGQLLAKRLAAGGAKVAVLDMNEAGMQETVSAQAGIQAYRCDVADMASVKSTLAAVRDSLGAIDLLVNCAAIMPTTPALDAPEGQTNKAMMINYGGTVNMVSDIMPPMVKAGRGQIVIFGSIAGSVLAPHLAAYCASKAATNAYTEILIEETRGTGVHVMLVCPPMVNTPLLKQAETGSNPKNIQMAKDKNRLASPEFIVDEVEKGLRKGTEILVPGGEAKTLMIMRRWMPRLLWKIVHLSMKSQVSGFRAWRSVINVTK